MEAKIGKEAFLLPETFIWPLTFEGPLIMIHSDEVTKTFYKNGSQVLSLDRFTADIRSGEFITVRGPSGSGKTTLLLTLGGMQRPSSGKVHFNKHDLYALSPKERASLRSTQIGFVFQMFYLVPYLDLLGNVLIAAPGKPDKMLRQRAVDLLEQFGLSQRMAVSYTHLTLPTKA